MTGPRQFGAGLPPSKLLPRLRLWIDAAPRPVAAQMALDEWLLETAAEPVLRLHCWERPCATFGYFLRWSELEPRLAAAGVAAEQAIRRPGGGGLVLHRDDTAFTLAVPAAHWRGAARFRDSHARIHERLGSALRQAGLAAGSVRREQGTDLDCFRHPVEHDLELAGRKIVGAGQRRSRLGLLHQGTLMLAPDRLGDGSWRLGFASGLAEEVREAGLEPDEGPEWWARVARFESAGWRRRR